ncbi:peptidase inhibitor family I36 protein [Actinoplanes sp. NPDC049599]|uniref:peptidase inhibitor family I36 protein n=1 Tax=Actinoplanes sp. NPDC049599 TaxID=3363903 RepID=UPI00378CD894
MSQRFIGLLAMVAGAILATALMAAPADAAAPGIQAQIDAIIAEHGGQQTGATQVTWRGGAVVLDLATPSDRTLVAVEGCPTNAYCFYEHEKFNNDNDGRRLTFRDCTAAGLRQNLYDYGFHDKTTSWVVNKSLRLVDVFTGTNTRLWQERAHSKSSNVGAADNDKADWFRCYL